MDTNAPENIYYATEELYKTFANRIDSHTMNALLIHTAENKLSDEKN